MKFMKLGSKPDLFQTDGDNIRYVATELATDITVNVGGVKFYLHKFPLLSKSSRLQNLVAGANGDEIDAGDIPGGPSAFEICAKFCYGMTVTLNAYNIAAVRCAAEYLGMSEAVEKGNLVHKIDVFLNSSVLRSWKDSIIVLQTTRPLLPWAEEIKIVGRCLDSIAGKAAIETSRVEWSYTYNRKKLPPETPGFRTPQAVPRDWWVEDLCDLHLDLYKRVLTTIRARGGVSSDVIGEALHAYALRRLPGFGRGGDNPTKCRPVAEAIIRLLPSEGVSCGFLLKLLSAAITLECSESERRELMGRVGRQLGLAAVADLLIRAPPGESTIYDIDLVQRLVDDFVIRERDECSDPLLESEFHEIRSPGFAPEASKLAVAKLVDGYLAEVARDPNMPLLKFVNLAEAVSGFPRPSHDGIYRAVDMFLKEHPGISKGERKRLCRLMDCRKLSPEACMHAVQNERLPLRVVVQVLFFEQIRASGAGAPEIPGLIRASIPANGSHGSSRSTTTNTEEDWDSVPTAEDIKALKGELAALKLAGVGGGDRAAAGKKGSVMSKRIFSKLWSGKERGGGEASSSETSESPGSTNAEETKSTPSARSGRLSAS